MLKELLKALAMPFQAASMLFVTMSALLLALVMSVVTTVGGLVVAPLALMAVFFLMVWLTQFAFALIDDAANGALETAPATAEMLSPLSDPRCWIHPVLAVAVGTTLALRPELPRLPLLAAAALLYPASLGAIAISGRALDALNPLALARVARGLGLYYVLSVLWVTGCVVLGLLIASWELWSALRFLMLELLLLLVYAFIGGALYARRHDLGFEPRVNPERAERREEEERYAQRQQMIDGLYSDLRTRDQARAAASASRWIAEAGPQRLPGDMQAILEAGAKWQESRGFALLLRSLVPQLLALRQPALAFAAVEAGMAAAPDFTPEQESDALAMIRYALQTGRKRLAATLLTNFVNSPARQGAPGAELQELRARLHNGPAPP